MTATAPRPRCTPPHHRGTRRQQRVRTTSSELAFYPGTVASSVNLLADDYASFEARRPPAWRNAPARPTITVSSTRALRHQVGPSRPGAEAPAEPRRRQRGRPLTIGQTYAQPLRVDRVRCRRLHQPPLSGPTFVRTAPGHGRVDLHDGGVGATRYTFTATATSHVLARDQRGRGNLTDPDLPRRLGAAWTSTPRRRSGSRPPRTPSAGSQPRRPPATVHGCGCDVDLRSAAPPPLPCPCTAGSPSGRRRRRAAKCSTRKLPANEPSSTAVNRGTLRRADPLVALLPRTCPSPVNDGTWWLKVVTGPVAVRQRCGGVRVSKGSLRYTVTEDVGVFRPLGEAGSDRRRRRPRQGRDGGSSPLGVRRGRPGGATLQRILKARTPLLLQDPERDAKYVPLGRGQEWTRFAGAACRHRATSYVEVGAP